MANCYESGHIVMFVKVVLCGSLDAGLIQ